MFSNHITKIARLAAQQQQQHQRQQQRNMATLKAISIRLKSVKNIQKITQSMKMVSAAKYNRAERDLRQARPLGVGTKAFYEQAEIQSPPEDEKKLVIAVTSDRGLCGAVHTGVSRNIRDTLLADPKERENTKIICIGEKSRAILSRLFANNILFVASEVGRKPPTFNDAAKVAIEVMNSGYVYFIKYRKYIKYQFMFLFYVDIIDSILMFIGTVLVLAALYIIDLNLWFHMLLTSCLFLIKMQ